MDRYLRYDTYFDGTPPYMFYERKLLNKENKIIGIRFKDSSTLGYTVFIDVPIKYIYEFSYIEEKTINRDIKEMREDNKVINFFFYKGVCSPLCFSLSIEEQKPIHLNDDFTYPNKGENLPSIFLPTCVIRYEDKEFFTIGSNKLLTAMNILHNKHFQEIFKPFHVEHMNFLNTADSARIYMKSRLGNKLADLDYFSDLLHKFHDKSGIDPANFYLSYSKEKDLLVLISSASQPDILPDEDFIDSEISHIGTLSTDSRFKYCVNKDKNKFFILPYGYSDQFGALYPASDDILPPDEEAFIEQTLNGSMGASVTYWFVKKDDRFYMFIGLTPKADDSIIEIITEDMDKCFESEDMELLQSVAGDYDDSVDFVIRKTTDNKYHLCLE